jgi:hypothetical protein
MKPTKVASRQIKDFTEITGTVGDLWTLVILTEGRGRIRLRETQLQPDALKRLYETFEEKQGVEKLC